MADCAHDWALRPGDLEYRCRACQAFLRREAYAELGYPVSFAQLWPATITMCWELRQMERWRWAMEG